MAPLLHQEITALRRIAVQDNAVDSEAFGPAYPNSVQALTAPHYHFTIRRSGTAGLELLIDKHVETEVERWFGFHGFFGLVACVGLVLAAKLLRRVISRPENYYDDR